jgi:hypothetical protein
VTPRAASAGALAQATNALETVRGGGEELAAQTATALLEECGCTEVRTLPRPDRVPLEFVIGRRPLG